MSISRYTKLTWREPNGDVHVIDLTLASKVLEYPGAEAHNIEPVSRNSMAECRPVKAEVSGSSPDGTANR
jgi:hypothetical protein